MRLILLHLNRIKFGIIKMVDFKDHALPPPNNHRDCDTMENP